MSDVRKNQIIRINGKNVPNVEGSGAFLCGAESHNGSYWIHFLNGEDGYEEDGKGKGLPVDFIKSIEKVK